MCYHFGGLDDYPQFSHLPKCERTHGTPSDAARFPCASTTGRMRADGTPYVCRFAPEECPYGVHGSHGATEMTDSDAERALRSDS